MLELIFPNKVDLEEGSIEYLITLNREVEKVKNSKIRMDFSCTTILAISHLAMLMYMVEGILKRKNELIAVFKNFEVEGEDVIGELYKYYGNRYNKFVNPYKLQFLYDNNEKQPWLDSLKNLELEKYDKIKVVISELVANLKMHTIFKEGTMAGYIDIQNKRIVLSIVNYDITIKNNLMRKQEMIFQNDYEAILWALKRFNTTRDDEESGGLGLYLLRKYIHELGAKCIIVSGNCFLKLDATCFDEKKENMIHVKKYSLMSCSYEGNIITLSFPLIISNKPSGESIKRGEISLGEMYGMHS